jgi:hypothetical protein
MATHTLIHNGHSFRISSYFKTLPDYAAYIRQQLDKAKLLNLNTQISQYRARLLELEAAGL